MDESQSLSHSKWECKYHVVFIPECLELLRPWLRWCPWVWFLIEFSRLRDLG